MSLVERIQNLSKEKKITIAELERKNGISNGQIRKWDNSTPGIDKLEVIADFFDVSTDYLLGRTDKKRHYDLNERNEKSIQDELENILNNFGKNGFAVSDGSTLDELDEDDKELLIAALEQSLRIAKRISKKKFTPKKYSDRD